MNTARGFSGLSCLVLRTVGECVKPESNKPLRMSRMPMHAAGASAGIGGIGGEEGGGVSGLACPKAIAITGKGESGMDHSALCPNPSRPRRRPCSHPPHPHRPKVSCSLHCPPSHTQAHYNSRCRRSYCAPAPLQSSLRVHRPHLVAQYISSTALSSPFFTSFLFHELARQHGGRGSCARTYLLLSPRDMR